MSRLIDHIKRVAADDVRLYFAPFRGAIEAVKKELRRPKHERDSRQMERPTRPADSKQ